MRPNVFIQTLIVAGMLLAGKGAYAQAPVSYNAMPFGLWLQGFRTEAMAQGITRETLDAALANIAPDERVVTLDRKQPESTLTFTQYKRNVLPQSRIDKARQLYRENKEVLEATAKKYGVPAKYIVALWGMESSFGSYMGNFSIVESLATLAYEGRRADFFKDELIKALRIIQDEEIYASDLTGSWAGAMGQCQFMPSSYLKFAVDADGDGKRDIWGSRADVFASIANYLSKSGWNTKESWGRKVQLPAGFDHSLESIENFRPLAEWKKLGVRAIDGSPLPDADIKAALIFAGRTTPDEGVYLIYPNYNVLLSWNRSRYFGTAVGTLADLAEKH